MLALSFTLRSRDGGIKRHKTVRPGPGHEDEEVGVGVGGYAGVTEACSAPQDVVASFFAAVDRLTRRCCCCEQHQRETNGIPHRTRLPRHAGAKILFCSGVVCPLCNFHAWVNTNNLFIPAHCDFCLCSTSLGSRASADPARSRAPESDVRGVVRPAMLVRAAVNAVQPPLV